MKAGGNFDDNLFSELTMTYEKLFYLKYFKGISTYDLASQYPQDILRVSEVAMAEIPEDTLRSIVKEEKALNRLMRLKRKYSRYLQNEG